MNAPGVAIGQPTEDMSTSASVSKFQTALVDSSPRKCAAQSLAERCAPEAVHRSLVRSLLAGAVKTRLSGILDAVSCCETGGGLAGGSGNSNRGRHRFGREILRRRGALFGKCRFIGLEQYSSLVTSAVALVDLFDLNDRVSFVAGALGAVPTPVGDACYFLQPVR